MNPAFSPESIVTIFFTVYRVVYRLEHLGTSHSAQCTSDQFYTTCMH